MPPLVSIIVPAFNAHRWIGAALDSALAQTWSEIEVLVVDDGSTDGTDAMVRGYGGRVKLFTQKQRGAAAARNCGLDHARGDFIQYLDADDLLSTDKVEAQVRLLQQAPPLTLTACRGRYFNDGTEPDSGLIEEAWVRDTDSPGNWLLDMWGAHDRFGIVPLGCWLTSRALAEKAGRWDDSVKSPLDDGEYFARVALASLHIRRADYGTYYYRKLAREGSYTSSGREELWWGRLHSINSVAERLLADGDSSELRRAMANSFLMLAFNAYPAHPRVTKQALQRVKDFGGTDWRPAFGTRKGALLRDLIGWKATRRLNVAYKRLRGALRTGS